MRTVIINENDSGQRVDKFLAKFLPQMPKSMLYKALRKKRVKRNRKALKEQDILASGDVLELYINDEFFERVPSATTEADCSDLSVVFEDENILVVDKPAGLAAHGGTNSLLAKAQTYLILKGEYRPEEEQSFAPALSNRIDRNTRGLLLVAKNAAAQRELNERIKNGEVTKEYLCLVCGTPKIKRGTLCHHLLSCERENRVKVVPAGTKGAKEARLLYEVQREGDPSLVHITLLTGRKHQIRVQMAAIGHPLVGDTKYGAPKDKTFSYQALCAYRLRFDFDAEGILSYLNGKTIELSEKPF